MVMVIVELIWPILHCFYFRFIHVLAFSHLKVHRKSDERGGTTCSKGHWVRFETWPARSTKWGCCSSDGNGPDFSVKSEWHKMGIFKNTHLKIILKFCLSKCTDGLITQKVGITCSMCCSMKLTSAVEEWHKSQRQTCSKTFIHFFPSQKTNRTKIRRMR